MDTGDIFNESFALVTAESCKAPPRGVITLPVATQTRGSVFGEDCLTKKPRFNFTAVAVEDNTEVMFINRKLALELIDDRTRDMIVAANRALHQDDICLVLNHEATIREKLSGQAQGSKDEVKPQNSR